MRFRNQNANDTGVGAGYFSPDCHRQKVDFMCRPGCAVAVFQAVHLNPIFVDLPDAHYLGARVARHDHQQSQRFLGCLRGRAAAAYRGRLWFALKRFHNDAENKQHSHAECKQGKKSKAPR